MTASQCKIALRNLDFLKVPEAALILGVDDRTLRRAIAAGEVPATRLGAAILVPTAWLRKQAQIEDA